jgi:hypothetical protein
MLLPLRVVTIHAKQMVAEKAASQRIEGAGLKRRRREGRARVDLQLFDEG